MAPHGSRWHAHQEALRLWAERGRRIWWIGLGALTTLQTLDAAASLPAERLIERLAQLAARPELPENPARLVPPPPPRPQAPAAPHRRPWTDRDVPLHDQDVLVLFVGTQAIRGQDTVLAIAVDGEGQGRVLGGCDGHTADRALARAVVQALAARGLDARQGLLVVHDGSRALDEVVRQTWGRRAVVAHCPQAVGAMVRAHLPATAWGALRAAWAAAARGAGDWRRLQRSLQEDHPGAAQRLARSLPALEAVRALGLPEPLASHLGGLGPVRVLAQHVARRAPAGLRGAAAVAAALAEVGLRMHRLIGYQALGLLRAALRPEDEAATGTKPVAAEGGQTR